MGMDQLNGSAFVFFSDEDSIDVALRCNGASFGDNGDLLGVSLVSRSTLDDLVEDVSKTLALKSKSRWSCPSVAKLLALVHSHQDFMFLPLLELNEYLQNSRSTLKCKLDSWIESFISTSIGDYNTVVGISSKSCDWMVPRPTKISIKSSAPMKAPTPAPTRAHTKAPTKESNDGDVCRQSQQSLGMSAAAAVRVGKTADEMRMAGVSSTSVQWAMKVTRQEGESGEAKSKPSPESQPPKVDKPHAKNKEVKIQHDPPAMDHREEKIQHDLPAAANWEDWLDKPMVVEVAKIPLQNTRNTLPIQSPVPLPAKPVSSSSGKCEQDGCQVIGEFTGRIKRPDNGQERFKGKSLFVLVVCRGKELKRLQELVVAHGWTSRHLDIFVHKNDWDLSVKQLFPDDKVKVKLSAPSAEHVRLKAVGLVKVEVC